MPPTKRSAPVRKERVLFFTQDRETKGTFRYAEDTAKGERGVMGTIWIQKAIAEEMDCVEEVEVVIRKPRD